MSKERYRGALDTSLFEKDVRQGGLRGGDQGAVGRGGRGRGRGGGGGGGAEGGDDDGEPADDGEQGVDGGRPRHRAERGGDDGAADERQSGPQRRHLGPNERDRL